MATPRNDNWLDAVASDLTPGLWRMRVRFVDDDGDDAEMILNWPADGAWRSTILDAVGPVEAEVKLEPRPGRNTKDERRRLKLPRQIQPLAVAVADNTRRPSPSVEDAPAPLDLPSDDPDEAVKREMRETARLEAECARVEAEAKLRRLKAGLDGAVAGADTGFAEMLRQQAELWREMLRESRERESRLLAELGKRSAAAPEQAAGLVGLRESLGLVREVLSVADSFRGDAGGDGDAGDSGAGGIVRVLREARGLLGVLPQRAMAAPAALAAPTAPAAPAGPAGPAAPAGAGAPAADAAARRVRAFVQQLVEELSVGSEPESVADELAAAVGLLPAPVRQGLDAGSWRQAWQAILPFVGAAEWNQVDAFLASSPVSTEWLDKFALALKEGAEDDQAE